MVVKRKRNWPGHNDEEQIQQMGPFITDLPWLIFLDILLKLSTRSIIMCKYVCKAWHALISDPEFAKLHFTQAEAYPMVRPCGSNRVSRTLYLVEPEDCSGFYLRDCKCQRAPFEFDQSHVHLNLAKYKIPLRNADEVIDNYNNVNAMLNKNRIAKRKSCVKLRPNDHKYNVVNSCNGFLCLSEPFFNDPDVVCNPVTGEFINLPQASIHENGEEGSIDCGFGFSPKNNQYKVIRIFDQETPHYNRVAEIYTLGTGSWKCVGSAPYSVGHMENPTYLKGALYWFYVAFSEYILLSFDLDNERFRSVPPPPFRLVKSGKVSLGVLGGCLCLCDSRDFKINVWIMNDCGAQKSWKNMFSTSCDGGGYWPDGLYKLMKILKNGDYLLFCCGTNALIYYQPGKYNFRYLQLRGFKSSFEAIIHVPSFISLRDILVGGAIEVLNINSRCAELKSLGESKALSLQEEDSGWALFCQNRNNEAELLV